MPDFILGYSGESNSNLALATRQPTLMAAHVDKLPPNMILKRIRIEGSGQENSAQTLVVGIYDDSSNRIWQATCTLPAKSAQGGQTILDNIDVDFSAWGEEDILLAHATASGQYGVRQQTTTEGNVREPATSPDLPEEWFGVIAQGGSIVIWAEFEEEDPDPEPEPPTLSSPTATTITQTTAMVGVSTNDDDGTLYVAVTESGTPPSIADIKSGSGAAFSDDNDDLSIGANTFPVTGLTVDTDYWAHFVQESSEGDSNIATAAFSRLAAVAPGLRFTLRDTDTGAVKDEFTYATVYVVNPADRGAGPLAILSNQETDSSGVLTVEHANITAEMLTGVLDIAGWSSDGSDRFHATATVIDIND